MQVTIRIINPAEIIAHTEVLSTFIDGKFYCVAEHNKVYKYRLNNIWLILEDSDNEKEAE